MIGHQNLKYNLAENKFLFFDVETEGLSLCRSRPWEVSWSIFHGKNKIREHQFYLKWPELAVCKGAADVTGFNPKIIEEKGKDPKEVIDLFDKDLYNPEYKIIGANLLGFDVYMHNVSRLILGYKTDYSYIDRIYDTLALSRAYKLGIKIPDDKDDFLAFQYRMLCIRKKGLKATNSAMYKELTGNEIDLTKLHQGLYDIELTSEVFFKLLDKLDIK